MGQQEEWSFGTAIAAVQRKDGAITARLRGAVTAMVLEALHMRLARERAALRRVLVLGDDAMLLVTNMSAAEASSRGTPRTAAGMQHVAIEVPSSRLDWARDHCDFMSRFGLSRSCSSLAAMWPVPARTAAS